MILVFQLSAFGPSTAVSTVMRDTIADPLTERMHLARATQDFDGQRGGSLD